MASDGLKAGDLITEPYPGFPTDMQAQYMALMTQANGRSVITETIFENRFMHASELQRMGARIQISHDKAIVDGPSKLIGARVQASDLRASASLVLTSPVLDMFVAHQRFTGMGTAAMSLWRISPLRIRK